LFAPGELNDNAKNYLLKQRPVLCFRDPLKVIIHMISGPVLFKCLALRARQIKDENGQMIFNEMITGTECERLEVGV
jgi:hypothetical protein